MRPIWGAGKHRRTANATCVLAVVVPIAAHAAGALSRPVLGYVFEPEAKAIRTIAGVPGAAILDEALPNANKIETAFIAPGRTFAVAEVLGDESSRIVRWNGLEIVMSPVSGALRGAKLAAFSPGEFAVVYYQEAGRLQVWHGLPDNPAVLREMECPEVAALAISDDGSVVAASGSAGVSLYSESGPKLVAGGQFSSISFVRGTHDIIAADSASDRIILIRDGEVNYSELAGPSNGITAPKAVAVSRDGKRLAIGGDSTSIVLVELESGATSPVPCECSAENIAPLKGDAVFLITSRDGTQWVLDHDGDEPRIVFAGCAR